MNDTEKTPMSLEELWELIRQSEGQPFFTAKGLPFTYKIRSGEMFVDRREKAKSITRSTVYRAYEKILEGIACGEPVTGPKKLNLFGAPYIWSILTTSFPEFKGHT